MTIVIANCSTGRGETRKENNLLVESGTQKEHQVKWKCIYRRIPHRSNFIYMRGCMTYLYNLKNIAYSKPFLLCNVIYMHNIQCI